MPPDTSPPFRPRSRTVLGLLRTIHQRERDREEFDHHPYRMRSPPLVSIAGIVGVLAALGTVLI